MSERGKVGACRARNPPNHGTSRATPLHSTPGPFAPPGIAGARQRAAMGQAKPTGRGVGTDVEAPASSGAGKREREATTVAAHPPQTKRKLMGCRARSGNPPSREMEQKNR
jgi:hypothetical protein